MIKAIIFDYDGVLVDSFPSVHGVYMKICKELGKSCPPDFEGFKEVYGYSSRDLMRNLDIKGEEIDRANEIYKKEITKINSPLFHRIDNVVRNLSKKYKLVLISSSPREEVMQKLDRFNLSKDFDLVFASDKSGAMRKPDAIKKTFEQLDVKPSEVIMIGDRTIDYDEGISVGIPSENIILVDYGWGYDSEKIPKQESPIKAPEDLFKRIIEIEKRLK